MQPTPVFLPGESSWTEEHRVAKSRTGLKRLKHTHIYLIYSTVCIQCVCVYIYIYTVYIHTVYIHLYRDI